MEITRERLFNPQILANFFVKQMQELDLDHEQMTKVVALTSKEVYKSKKVVTTDNNF